MFTFIVIFAGSLFLLLAVQKLDIECVNAPQLRRARQPALRPAKPSLKGIIAATR